MESDNEALLFSGGSLPRTPSGLFLFFRCGGKFIFIFIRAFLVCVGLFGRAADRSTSCWICLYGRVFFIFVERSFIVRLDNF
jgi:hypothetical protein